MPQSPPPKGRKRPAEILTQSEICALLKACSPHAPTGIRNRALISLLYRSGLRISEALTLYPKDIALKDHTLRVLHGKGDRARTVGIDPSTLDGVQRWLERRKALGIGARAPVFCTLQGGALKTAYIRALLPRLARKAGIAKRVHAHGLRHAHAVELVQEGVPVHLIQQQLGHASLQTTSVYLNHIAPQQLIDVVRKRTWPMP